MGDETDGPTGFRASIVWGLVAVAVCLGLLTAVQAYLMGPGDLAAFWPRLAVVALLLLVAGAAAYGLGPDD